MILDTTNKNIHVYGLGVGTGDLSDFEIIGHFLFEGGRDYHA
jgi:hypothetical protein